MGNMDLLKAYGGETKKTTVTLTVDTDVADVPKVVGRFAKRSGAGVHLPAPKETERRVEEVKERQEEEEKEVREMKKAKIEEQPEEEEVDEENELVAFLPSLPVVEERAAVGPR